MGEIMDVRLGWYVLHRKRFIAVLKSLSSGEELEFIMEKYRNRKRPDSEGFRN